LAGGNVVDPNEVAAAQKSVEDAKYQIQIAGLEKTATAEETAYNAQVDLQEKAIRQMGDKATARGLAAAAGHDVDELCSAIAENGARVFGLPTA